MKTKTLSLVLVSAGVIILLVSAVYSNLINPEMMSEVVIPIAEDAAVPGPVQVDTSNHSKTPNACSGSALCTTDVVTRIVDGDTLYTQNYRIRLALTNTPEKQEPGFSDATLFTGEMCPVGSVVSIDQDDLQKTDVYGRMVAKVTCSGKVLNAELLDSGHGVILQQYCKKSEFASEDWAKKFGC